MKRNYITKQMLSIIIKSKDYFSSNKLFLSVFLILKFLGIAILTNSLEHNIPSTITTYNFLQNLTYYSSFSRSTLNYIPYGIACLIIYIILLLPIISMAIILRIIFGNFFNYNQKKEDAVNYQNAFFVKEEINEYSDKNYLILNFLLTE